MALTVMMLKNVTHLGTLYAVGTSPALADDLARQWVYEGRAKMVSVDPAAAQQAALMAIFSSPTSLPAFQAFGRAVTIPLILAFPDFSPSILASFVTGTTAVQAGTTVTVTAPAHGIVGNTSKNGYRIYYPGSPSIPAGWYSGFAWIDANTVTFTNPVAQAVASESVNGGLAYTATTTICSLTLPGGSMGPNGRITLVSLHSGDTSGNAKFLRLVLGGAILHGISLGALVSWLSRQSVANNAVEIKQDRKSVV